MRYLGSKARFAKSIIPIIMKHLNGENEFVDAFMGGANILSNIDYTNKVGIEYSLYSWSIWNDISIHGIDWIPRSFDEEDYYDVKASYKNKDGRYKDAMIGYVGNCLSYGSKWWGGFAKFNPKKNEDHVKEAYNGIKKQYENFHHLDTTRFYHMSYNEYDYKPHSVIYCDPPYHSTIGYESLFNHDEFWDWVRFMTNKGHYVYVSEYSAPSDMTCIWRKSVNEQVGKNINQKIEKLFIYDPFHTSEV